ncbi:MAG: hypothetical protein J6R38_05775 [Alistipes sp.]|nr:hypothetical protein [Alistipes sp.]
MSSTTYFRYIPPSRLLGLTLFATAVDMWQKLAFTFVLLSSFVLLYRRDGIRSRIARLSTYDQGPFERLWHKWTWM